MKKGVLLVEAIFEALRSDEVLGRGGCSCLDECVTDDELKADIIEDVAAGTYNTIKQAVAWYRRIENIGLERDAECGI